MSIVIEIGQHQNINSSPKKSPFPIGCRTCASFHKYSDDYECKYTNRGIVYLKDCPCENCLLKTMCLYSCDLMNNHPDAASHYLTTHLQKKNNG
jgi:hypothetical protein